MFLFFFIVVSTFVEKHFKTKKNLRLHLQAAHDALVTVENPQSNSCANSAGKFCCTINVCRKEFDRFSLLSKHLKYHLKAKEQIKCPFKGCKNEYSAITSFTSHLTKKHRKDYRNIPKNVTESVNNVPTQNEPIPVPNDPIESPLCGQSSDSSNHDTAEVSHDELPDPSTLDINRIAQFYLKLESKLLLPVSTIQEIVSEIINLHSESQAIIKEQLKKKLIGEGILPERVQEIVEEVFMSDIFSQGHEVLRTNFRRKKYYKKHFDHVDPDKLDIDKSKKTSFAYIPLLKTLKAVGKDKSVQFHFHKKRKPSKSGVLRDFFDGDAFKKNEFFINNPGALEIILYQDAFEIVNPIGSSKKKHKILAVYMIAERIKDPDDAVWLSFLTLTEVVEIVCAPMIHESYLPYLDSLICDYLSLRKKLFPTFNLRPKHHYMRHYAKLIFFFGPLIKVGTMRFESKHKFFKRSIRYSMNFINVLKSLSEKHELFQTYVRLGADTRFDVETVETNPFEMSCNLYRQEILDAIRKTVPSVQNLFESCSVVIKGTEYKKGYVLSISQRGYQDHVVLGKMCLFLSDSDQNIYILFEILNHSFEPRLRAYQIQNTESYECRAISEEMNLKPMPIYKVHNMFLVKPKYGFVSTPL
ncbi:hypothetical protein QAD02_022176 [Eretmocerus hayati]|uniref:Uncharacterized protein n=1 Tax=Eretmocerus hayati TaxID=131215 RepID=A0ACC2PVK2_9HYME|nr:hypothetical protein QAD02_022176 [Eretmocerus hayati]